MNDGQEDEKTHHVYLGLISSLSGVTTFQTRIKVRRCVHILGNHPKPANDNHLKTGQRTNVRDKVFYSFKARSGKRVLLS